MRIFKSLLGNLWLSAYKLDRKNSLSFLEKDNSCRLLDLGCNDGSLTMKLVQQSGAKEAFGIDIIEERLREAEKKGIKPVLSNLNDKFPFAACSFDVVCANQIIEHVSSLDRFVSDIFRVLKPGGYAIISTENASSWCNIFASLLGWQMFSLTNVSDKVLGIGNPLAVHRGRKDFLSSWTHKTVLNFLGLKELLEVHGFKVEGIKGAGYFPLPAFLGNIDKIHAHFLTLKLRKPRTNHRQT